MLSQLRRLLRKWQSHFLNKVWWFFCCGHGVAVKRRILAILATVRGVWWFLQPFYQVEETAMQIKEFTRLALWFSVILHPRRSVSGLWVTYPIKKAARWCSVGFTMPLFRVRMMPIGWEVPINPMGDPWYDISLIGFSRHSLMPSRYSDPEYNLDAARRAMRLAIRCLRGEDMTALPVKYRLLRELFLWLTRDLARVSEETAGKPEQETSLVWRLTGHHYDLAGWLVQYHSLEVWWAEERTVVVYLHLSRWHLRFYKVEIPILHGPFLDLGALSIGVTQYDMELLQKWGGRGIWQ